jgi:predicted dithiol-disulfide oxidoreductase (DUF899 family)
LFGPEDSVPCIGCSFTGDSFDGAVFHLAFQGHSSDRETIAAAIAHHGMAADPAR